MNFLDLPSPRRSALFALSCSHRREEVDLASGPTLIRLLTSAATKRTETFLLLFLLAFISSAAASFVYENDTEFTATGDLDGNSLADVVVVDRATGQYRVAYQSSPGNYQWAASRPSGIAEVRGVALGRLLHDTLQALAVTAPDANRLNVLSAANPAAAALPVSWYVPSIGPTLITALDIGGTGNTARDDIVAITTLNGFNQVRYEVLRNATGSALTPLDLGTFNRSAGGLNPIQLVSGGPTLAGLVLRTPFSNTFKAYALNTGLLSEIASTQNGLPARADYVFGRFNPAHPRHQFLFYMPGSNALYLRPISEPAPGTFAFDLGPTFDLGHPIRQVFPLQYATSARLLILFGQGDLAQVFTFDGLNAPILSQSLAPGAGEAFTTASILPNGDFLLFSGSAGSGVSSHFQSYAFNGMTYVPGQFGSLPALSEVALTANVLHYSASPFLTPSAAFLGSVNAGDWTSQYTLPGGQAQVLSETLGGMPPGLGNPVAINLGLPPAGTTFGLVNQYTQAVSLFSLRQPLGHEIVHVTIDPPSGQYAASFRATLLSRTPNVTLFYRLNNSGNWATYAQPFWIHKNTTVDFYGQSNPASANAKSAIHTAQYTFTLAPDALDSDGDRVPDYVEISKGLDPTSGNDHDGDGFFDLDELVSGFDANNAASHPPLNHSRPELNASVDVIQTPRPWDGILNAASLSGAGTRVAAYDLQGNLYQDSTVIFNPPQTGVPTPAVVLSNIVVDTGLRLLAVATEPHFNIAAPYVDPRIGRELVRFLDSTRFSVPVSLPATWNGGNVVTETDAWINAASNQLKSTSHQRIIGDMTVSDTLAALLLERKTQLILISRGLNQYSNLTLFPFRPADANRTTPAGDELLALETHQDPMHPGYSPPTFLHSIENVLGLGSPFGPNNLLTLTREIYRISSASNNIPNNLSNSWPVLPSPINTLRDFIATGLLHSNYLVRTTMLPGGLSAAHTEANSLLQSLGPRPFTNVTLVVRSDTFSGYCTLLDSTDHTQLWTLLQPDATPYPILEAFNLLPGSQVLVIGYTDPTNTACQALGLEVLSISLEFVPAVTPEDSDGDLLLDALELALFGSLFQSGLGDADGDGYSNLQEQWSGSDLSNGGNAPSGPPVNLSPPQILIQSPAGSSMLSLSWSWPAAFANKIQFVPLVTPNIGNPFAPISLAPTQTAPGQFQFSIPIPPGAPMAPPQQFFQLLMTLKSGGP